MTAKEIFMQKALAQAQLAFRHKEVPVGAVVVYDNKIIARAYNCVERCGCQSAHAEVQAIQRACKKLGGWRLSDCWLYVTLEPCMMCLGLVLLSRLRGVIYGTESPLFGAQERIVEVVPSLRTDIHIEGGVLAEDCAGLLKSFFFEKRKKEKGGNGETKS
jgi:tRNA(adenine34) deaminase